MTEDYHYISQSRPEMLSFMPDIFQTVLEVGCGDGSFAVQLKVNQKIEVWGAEMNLQQAQLASEKIDRVLAGDFVEMVQNGLIPPAYFDCIVFNDALEHFPDTLKILDLSKKLLKPGGFLVTSLPNFRYVGNLWEILIQKDFKYKDSGILDRTHFRFFTMKSISRLLNENGFEILKISGINPTGSMKVKILNMLTFNFFSDIKYMQIASLARLRS